MKFGVGLFLLRHQQIIDVTLQAERLGFDSVWLGEHVVTPAGTTSEFPYAGEADTAHQDFNPNIPFFDTHAVLAYLAAITKTLKLGVSVSIVPLHDPFHLARQVTTLDIFSQGRFILGIGTGWLKEEFDVLGLDFAKRGKRLDESLDIMVSLFNEEITTYHGEQFQVPPIGFSPKPVTRPHPPFYFGGHGKPALRRAAERGDGWIAVNLSPEEVGPLIAELKQLRRAAGRDALPFEFGCGLQDNRPIDRDLVERYRDAGVERLRVSPWSRGREAADSLARFAEQVF